MTTDTDTWHFDVKYNLQIYTIKPKQELYELL